MSGGGIRSTQVNHVWLVWDGFGGCVFQLCETKRDARRIKEFHNNSKRIRIEKCPVWAVAKMPNDNRLERLGMDEQARVDAGMSSTTYPEAQTRTDVGGEA